MNMMVDCWSGVRIKVIRGKDSLNIQMFMAFEVTHDDDSLGLNGRLLDANPSVNGGTA